MEYYVFLINKNIPTKEELEFEGENRYDELVFISLKDTSKIKDYISKFDNNNISHDYFVSDDIMKSKNKLYSFNRYYKNVIDNNYITERINSIEMFSFSSIEYYTEEEKDIPNNNGKINIYSNKDIKNNFLNIIKIKENNILRCYHEELDYDHSSKKGYFYYLFDNELYKIDIKKPYIYKENLIANHVNRLEIISPNDIKHKIRENKTFIVYLLNSDEININTNLDYMFIKVRNKKEILLSISKKSMLFCYSLYFIIKNNDTISMKWKTMDFKMSKPIKNIEDEININVYSNKEIEEYKTIIATSSLEAYEMEMHKNHYKRNGYFLYINDEIITRLSLMKSNRNEKIVQGNLKDIISETNLLDWE